MEKIEKNIKDKVHVLQNITLIPAKAKTPKDQLKLLYPDLKRVRTKVDLEFPNSDVYLFRIPCCVDPFLLLNKEINLEENSKLKLDKKYLIESTTKLTDAKLFVSDNSKVLNLRKNFILTRYIKVKKQSQNSVVKQSNIKLPENIKDGPSFEAKINLSEEDEKKLDKAIANIMERKIKNKKVRKIIQTQEDYHHENEVICDLHNAQTSSESKIKAEISSCITMNSKKEKNNESSLINNSIIEAVKREVEYETAAETKIHKKKRKKVREYIDCSSVETIEKDVFNHMPQEENMKSTANSTFMLATSDIQKKEKKRKQQPTFEEFTANTKTSNILDDISSEVSLPKKVKKKKRDKSLGY